MINDLKKEDSAWMYQLATQAYGQSPWTEAQFYDDFSSCRHHQKGYWVKQKKVAFVQYHGDHIESEIINLAVDPKYQGQGIAKELLQDILNEAKTWLLEVRESNIKAKALYESLGFEVIAQRKQYYQNPREDALIMRRDVTV